MATIAERLKTAMELRNVKQADLVDKTGINKGALSCYLSGKYEPKQQNIYLLAKALDVSEEWLMGKDVSMERKIQSADAEEFLRLFQQSSPEMRKAALAVLKAGQQTDEPPE